MCGVEGVTIGIPPRHIQIPLCLLHHLAESLVLEPTIETPKWLGLNQKGYSLAQSEMIRYISI